MPIGTLVMGPIVSSKTKGSRQNPAKHDVFALSGHRFLTPAGGGPDAHAGRQRGKNAREEGKRSIGGLGSESFFCTPQLGSRVPCSCRA